MIYSSSRPKSIFRISLTRMLVGKTQLTGYAQSNGENSWNPDHTQLKFEERGLQPEIRLDKDMCLWVPARN